MNAGTEGRSGCEVYVGTVREEWIDVNDHMNVAYYVLAFDQGVDSLWERFGITNDYIAASRCSTFAVESHITWKQELRGGAPYVVTSEVLAYDEKRLHQFMRIYHAEEGYLASTAEWMNLHVDLERRRVTPWPEPVLAAIGAFAAEQGASPRPPEAGRRLQIAAPYWSIEDYSF